MGKYLIAQIMNEAFYPEYIKSSYKPMGRRQTAQLKNGKGTSPVVQWLRLRAPTAGPPGWIPGQVSCVLQLSLQATTKDGRSLVPQPKPSTAK